MVEDQKKSLTDLLYILVQNGLKFFETKNSSSPATIEFNSFFVLSPKQQESRERYHLSEPQYRKLQGLFKLQQKYPEVFNLFWAELEVVKDNLSHPMNFAAKSLWEIWQTRQNTNAKDNLKHN